MLSGVASVDHQTVSLLWKTFSVAVLGSCSRLCRCHVWAVSMAENHLEYGYLEGECIGEYFAEDPVGIIVFAVNPKGCCHVCSFVRTSVGRASGDCHVGQTSANTSYAKCCIVVSLINVIFKERHPWAASRVACWVTCSACHGANQVHCMPRLVA